MLNRQEADTGCKRLLGWAGLAFWGSPLKALDLFASHGSLHLLKWESSLMECSLSGQVKKGKKNFSMQRIAELWNLLHQEAGMASNWDGFKRG